VRRTAAALLTLLCCAPALAAAAPAPAAPGPQSAQDAQDPAALLGPPAADGPVVVRARLVVHDILELHDEKESFDFTGVLTLTWKDPRQAFDPAVAGTHEKVFQGNYQFNEVSPGWYPQLVLVNSAGLYEGDGVVLRVLPDGASTLTQTLTASAKVQLNMRRFPLDTHRLEAVFEVLGFDRDEVRLEVDPAAGEVLDLTAGVPQWSIIAARLSVRDRDAAYTGPGGVSSTFVLTLDVRRETFHLARLVVFPLAVIVLLSFSVFWMDRSSLGDRISVSFIGLLTSTTYQAMVNASMPNIAYATVMHGFLTFSFATMCATVLINLRVGALDKRGRHAAGDRLDFHCRWIFPLSYVAAIALMVAVAFVF
jgi:hypothetical protein